MAVSANTMPRYGPINSRICVVYCVEVLSLTHVGFNVQTGEQLENVQAHEFDYQINDIQFSPDRTYFITACKDKSAKVRAGVLIHLSAIHYAANSKMLDNFLPKPRHS